MILWTNFIQIYEVHTHPPFSILLFYFHSIGQPLRVKDFFNCSSLFKLVYLHPYYLCMLFRRSPRRLSPWYHTGIHIQQVTNKLEINPRNIISTPSKDVNIIFQKLHQHCFFQGGNCDPTWKYFSSSWLIKILSNFLDNTSCDLVSNPTLGPLNYYWIRSSATIA